MASVLKYTKITAPTCALQQAETSQQLTLEMNSLSGQFWDFDKFPIKSVHFHNTELLATFVLHKVRLG